MSDTARPRYGYDAGVAFAATRAFAARQAREAAAVSNRARTWGDIRDVVRRLVTRGEGTTAVSD